MFELAGVRPSLVEIGEALAWSRPAAVGEEPTYYNSSTASTESRLDLDEMGADVFFK